jgi:DNA-binding NarL/FixJ family response regulator
MPNLAAPQPNTISTNCHLCGFELPADRARRICSSCRKLKLQKRGVSRQVTLREKQVIELVCQGKLNKEIAFQLCLTEGTIKEYLHRIFVKVDVSNRTELAVWAVTQPESAA